MTPQKHLAFWRSLDFMWTTFWDVVMNVTLRPKPSWTSWDPLSVFENGTVVLRRRSSHIAGQRSSRSTTTTGRSTTPTTWESRSQSAFQRKDNRKSYLWPKVKELHFEVYLVDYNGQPPRLLHGFRPLWAWWLDQWPPPLQPLFWKPIRSYGTPNRMVM